MQVYKTTNGIIIVREGQCYEAKETNWDLFINRDELHALLLEETTRQSSIGGFDWLGQQQILAPVGNQEVWAAGVTYLRSKAARMEESKDSGASVFYDKVYDAARPELFFKGVGSRVIGPGGYVRIRKDSTWNVPEPELTLVVTSSSKIVGYAIGNDMSSRDIEGENPLYLPQAKVYDGSAAIGPCVLVPREPVPGSTSIAMQIEREGKDLFTGKTTIDRMKRSHTELVDYLFREYSHPLGCYLMTGTCVVPENDFTLQSGDRVTIQIDGIGTLINTVA
ncbi:MAG: fumarylacetoacetate hydrolase family protein [Chitinophagales bacterium]|nr:fumarylacetoacetate hydrolase family protein [Chitinophagales bacterium]